MGKQQPFEEQHGAVEYSRPPTSVLCECGPRNKPSLGTEATPILFQLNASMGQHGQPVSIS